MARRAPARFFRLTLGMALAEANDSEKKFRE